MLIALKDNGERIMSLNLKKKKDEKYRCPCCLSPVILKKGESIIPHFAHLSKKECSGEKETNEHLLGKDLIAKNCELFDIPYKVEAYLPEIKQRPDILLDDKIAIEFQCSLLSIKNLDERTNQYIKAGYKVFWILGGKMRAQKKLTKLKQHLLCFNNLRGYHYFEMDVVRRKIICNMYLTNHSNYQALVRKEYSLEEKSIINILLNSLEETHQLKINNSLSYVNHLKNKWQHSLLRGNKTLLVIQTYFYERGTSLVDLPLIIYLPVITHPFLSTWEYVIRFEVNYFIENSLQDFFVIMDIYNHVIEEVPTKIIFDYPLLSQKQLVCYSISLYICFLEKIGKLTKDEVSNYYFINNSFNIKSLDKNIENKSEIIFLPLKYDMINKH